MSENNYWKLHRNDDELEIECHHCHNNVKYNINSLSHYWEPIKWPVRVELNNIATKIMHKIPFLSKYIKQNIINYFRQKFCWKTQKTLFLKVKCDKCNNNINFLGLIHGMPMYKIHREYINKNVDFEE